MLHFLKFPLIMIIINGCHHYYTGMTTTRLSKRIAIHLPEWAVYNTAWGNTAVLTMPADHKEYQTPQQDMGHCSLCYKEALTILRWKPALNVTQEALLLLTTIRRTTSSAPETVLQPPSSSSCEQRPQRTNQCPR